jgi:hypothetical protein
MRLAEMKRRSAGAFAAKFLDSKDPDEAKVKKLLAGIDGIYIKSFEFKKGGGYAPADVDSVRAQLRAPEWSRIIGVKSSADDILCAAPKELTVVNIVGPVDLDSLADLGGHFGVPKLKK